MIPNLLLSIFYRKNIVSIDAKTAKKHQNDFLIIDVREKEEFENKNGHINESIHIPMRKLIHIPELLKEFKNRNFLIVCSHGRRSKNVIRFLSYLGYKNLYNLDGGLLSWKKRGYPLLNN